MIRRAALALVGLLAALQAPAAPAAPAAMQPGASAAAGSSAPPAMQTGSSAAAGSSAPPATAASGSSPELAPLPPPQTGAPLATGIFRFRRGIRGAPPGVVALPLDAAVLAHAAADLGDLRIVDAAGRQVPYILDLRAEPDWLALGAVARQPAQDGDAPGSTRYAIRLPYTTLPRTRLVLTTPVRVFERTVHLWQAPPAGRGRTPDGNGDGGAREVAVAIWRHADPATSAPPLVLDLPAAGGACQLTLDEGDNAPLPLDPPRLQLPAYQLRYVQPAGGSLRLFYGAPDLAAPRYDLSLSSAALLARTAPEATLLPEPHAADVPDADRAPRTVFWVALAVAVAILLGLLARLLREPALAQR